VRPLLTTDDPYLYVGNDPGSYVPVPWERHIMKAARGDEVVPPFLQALSDPAMVENVIDMNDMLAYLAAAAITMDTDGFVGRSGVSDHFQYFDPQSGKFFILPWDPDSSWDRRARRSTESIYSRMGGRARDHHRDRAISRAAYEAKIADGMTTVPLATLQAQADSIFSADPRRPRRPDQDVSQRRSTGTSATSRISPPPVTRIWRTDRERAD
jgi:hypothetical protein